MDYHLWFEIFPFGTLFHSPFSSARSGRRGQRSYLTKTVWVKCGLLTAFLRSVQLADKEHSTEADLSFLLAVAEDDANNDEAK